MENSIKWDDDNIKPGDNPVCIVGAGFQKAVLDKDSKRPSTDKIIVETVKKNQKEFPILSTLYKMKYFPYLNLNYIWKNIELKQHLSPLLFKLSIYYENIKKCYSSINNKITKVIEWYDDNIFESNPEKNFQIISVVFGLELKKMIAYQYSENIDSENKSKINKNYKLNDKNKEQSKEKNSKSNIKGIISKSNRFTWVSLNYDLVLEKWLMGSNEEKIFNKEYSSIKYSFEPLLLKESNYNLNNIKHLIIKPHGSINVVFNTNNQNTINKIHEVYFKCKKDYLKTFEYKDIGYDIENNIINEQRPWIIGYLPDEMKDELNSPGLFSDPAHDLCKWNMAYTTFALEKATSIFILGYSMPEEDQWIWERLKNINNKKKIRIYIASGSNSKRIKLAFNNIDFQNAKIVNDGWI